MAILHVLSSESEHMHLAFLVENSGEQSNAENGEVELSI